MYNRILLPLDQSDLDAGAIAFVELIPSRSVRLVQVQTDPGAMGGASPEVRRTGTDEDATSPDAQHYLDRAAEKLRQQGRKIEIAVETGDPGQRIVELADDADLIVMATRGQGVAGGPLTGSVADHVVHHARVPTLLVRSADRQTVPAIGRIVVPLDRSAESESVLPAAVRLSRILGLRIHLVHVVGDERQSTKGDEERRDATDYLDKQVRRLNAQDAVAKGEVLTGRITATLLDFIGPSDLVLMATRGRRPGGEYLGGVAERLVREARGAVLLVR